MAKRANPTAETLVREDILAVKKTRRIPTLSQLKHLPRFLSLKEKRLALSALLLALFAGGALGFTILAQHQTLVPAVGGSYTEGLIGTPSRINPLYASVSDVDNDLTHLTFSGLLRFDPEKGLEPDLATSYTASPDGKSYTFILRDNVRFHNGDPLTSADVAFTYRAIQNPEYGSPLSAAFSGVTVETPDERTVTLVLPEPSAAFLGNLTVGILPSGLWSDIPPGNSALAKLNLKPVGTGPYKFEKLTMDNKGALRSMTFTRNKDYYRGAPFLETLQFKFANSVNELPNLLRNKNVEGAVTVPFADVPKFKGDRSLTVFEPFIPQYTAAFFNMKSTGVMSDPNIRKALDAGTDRQAVVEKALGGRGVPLSTILVKGMPGAVDPTQVPGADIPLALSSLEVSGYKIPEGGTVRMKGETALTVSVTFTETAELTAVAEELKRQWEAMGITVNLKPMGSDELQNDILRNRNFDILLAGELYGAFRDPYPYWHSSQAADPGLNITGLIHRAADEAIGVIRSTPDEAKRAENYAALSKILTDQHVAAFLYQPSYAYVTGSNIKGITLPAINLPADRFANINLWYIKTRAVLKK